MTKLWHVFIGYCMPSRDGITLFLFWLLTLLLLLLPLLLLLC
jgi:hypothetical protein